MTQKELKELKYPIVIDNGANCVIQQEEEDFGYFLFNKMVEQGDIDQELQHLLDYDKVKNYFDAIYTFIENESELVYNFDIESLEVVENE